VRRTVIAVAAFVFVAVAGCAQPGFDAAKLQRELRRAGLTQDQAKCVTDAMKNSFDTNQLASISDPTQKELTKTRTILQGCGVTKLRS
jgi:hypothetical protein